jgi:hypothetical protein
MNYPNIKSLLPKEGKEIIKNFFLERMKEAPLNTYGNSTFRLEEALKLINESDDPYARSIGIRCYLEAEKFFKKLNSLKK